MEGLERERIAREKSISKKERVKDSLKEKLLIQRLEVEIMSISMRFEKLMSKIKEMPGNEGKHY